jgi:hypothetical protein
MEGTSTASFDWKRGFYRDGGHGLSGTAAQTAGGQFGNDRVTGKFIFNQALA